MPSCSTPRAGTRSKGPWPNCSRACGWSRRRSGTSRRSRIAGTCWRRGCPSAVAEGRGLSRPAALESALRALCRRRGIHLGAHPVPALRRPARGDSPRGAPAGQAGCAGPSAGRRGLAGDMARSRVGPSAIGPEGRWRLARAESPPRADYFLPASDIAPKRTRRLPSNLASCSCSIGAKSVDLVLIVMPGRKLGTSADMGRWRPQRQLKSVVLPAPLSPITATMRPASCRMTSHRGPTVPRADGDVVDADHRGRPGWTIEAPNTPLAGLPGRASRERPPWRADRQDRASRESGRRRPGRRGLRAGHGSLQSRAIPQLRHTILHWRSSIGSPQRSQT